MDMPRAALPCTDMRRNHTFCIPCEPPRDSSDSFRMRRTVPRRQPSGASCLRGFIHDSVFTRALHGKHCSTIRVPSVAGLTHGSGLRSTSASIRTSIRTAPPRTARSWQDIHGPVFTLRSACAQRNPTCGRSSDFGRLHAGSPPGTTGHRRGCADGILRSPPGRLVASFDCTCSGTSRRSIRTTN